jgi:Flp pilus assembly protein TadG
VKDIVHSKRSERGATLILVTFVATFVMIPIIGLAIDGTMLYWTKARLSAAVDAAALAAGRALNVGADEAAQEAYATTIGQGYFAANFPTGTGSRSDTMNPGDPTFAYDTSRAHIRTVTVNATTIVPLLFMPILHVNTGTVAATGTASRRDVNIILLLDRSSSMNNSSGACSALIASAQSFVARFTNGRDSLGLVTFSSIANIDFQPSDQFKTVSPNLTTVLSTLKCSGYTSTAEGLHTAHQLIKGLGSASAGALNVILLFTDGSPSSITADFPIKTQADTRYGIGTNSSNSYTNPNTAVPASTCASSLSSVTGLLTDASSENATSVAGLHPTGRTDGLFQVNPPMTPPITLTSTTLLPPLLKPAGCKFSSDQTAAREDIANIPETDRNTNSTAGAVPNVPPPDRFTSGPYLGLIRPDMPRTVRWVAFSAADAQAQTIHNDAIYTPVIYTIGLAGNETMQMNYAFMERLANDPRANNYDETKPQGQFILATDNAGVAAAFNQIASQVLHLSK